ncbi:CLI_3235 family bacteriocin precursor [Clostridium pasteurianum]|uniref:Uncharacterized protein n=1 Tax=Clostridium pasteurianum BC1 TaxID=86416 RepID=R4KGG8_CLOPA|nr:CLI_3235 family bacteriocin precursor [Clostridium pasteurianum]AGK99604.1 hypothetical protein Clopa_4935 [Clostridium pasteurianum BC1]
MKLLGKKHVKVMETIEAYACSGVAICNCSGTGTAYSSLNDQIYWDVFWS